MKVKISKITLLLTFLLSLIVHGLHLMESIKSLPFLTSFPSPNLSNVNTFISHIFHGRHSPSIYVCPSFRPLLYNILTLATPIVIFFTPSTKSLHPFSNGTGFYIYFCILFDGFVQLQKLIR